MDLIFQSASIVEPIPEADLVFQSPVTAQPLELALLSEEEMAQTEGEFWPIAYGLTWAAARGAIWAAGRFGTRWGFRAIRSSNNHRILLRNNHHILQTGGSRGLPGTGQNASHIGWGTSSRNHSTSHVFYNRPWSIN